MAAPQQLGQDQGVLCEDSGAGAPPGVPLPPPATGTNLGNQTVYIYVQQEGGGGRSNEFYKRKYAAAAISGLSITQVIVGAVVIVSQIIVLVYDPWAGLIGQGIWCGFFCALAGALGLVSAKVPSACTIITYMILSIFSAAFAFILLVFSSIALTFTDSRYSKVLIAAVYGLHVLSGLVEMGVSIAGSILCCTTVCCCAGDANQANAGQAYYLNSGPQNDHLISNRRRKPRQNSWAHTRPGHMDMNYSGSDNTTLAPNSAASSGGSDSAYEEDPIGNAEEEPQAGGKKYQRLP